MVVEPFPERYHTVTPDLVVSDIAQLIDYLKQAFDAKVKHRLEAPDQSVMHVEVRIGDSAILIGQAQDGRPAMPGTTHLYVEDVDVVYEQALRAGGESLGKPRGEINDDRKAGVKDPLGNQWWIVTHEEDAPHDERRRREAVAPAQEWATSEHSGQVSAWGSLGRIEGRRTLRADRSCMAPSSDRGGDAECNDARAGVVTRRFVAFACLFTLACFVMLATLYYFGHRERWAFEAKVRPGMSKLQVRQEVGPPEEILHAGDEFADWGNSAPRIVDAETWLYRVFPKFQNRFVLTFQDEWLTHVERRQD